MFDASPDATLIVDSRGIIRDLNRQALVMFGWSREEMRRDGSTFPVDDALVVAWSG